mgnify:CR=1 FL=1
MAVFTNVTTLRRIEFSIPIEIIAPAFMQEVRRKGAAVFLQLEAGRSPGFPARNHAAFARQPAALMQIAPAAGGDDILPDRPPAARTRRDMIESQIMRIVQRRTILAGKPIAQEDVESRESRETRYRDEFLERDHARQFHLKIRRTHDSVIFRQNADPLHEYGLHRILPMPERKREVA